MAHELKLSCPSCQQHTHGFTHVEYTFCDESKQAVFTFTAFCMNCKSEVFTNIGADVFAEWAARDRLDAAPKDEDFLRNMNIVWNENAA